MKTNDEIIWMCNKTLRMKVGDKHIVFNSGTEYRQVIGREFTLIDEDHDEHGVECWSKWFTKA